MDSNKTIRHLFSMDKKRFLTYERKLLDLAPTADEMLKDLNRPEALDEAGRRDLAIGAGLVVVAGLLATLSVAFGSLLIAGALTVGFLGMWFVATGWPAATQSGEIRRRAYDRMLALEGATGLLWRFEPFLLDFDESLPAPVRDTLPDMCASSRSGSHKDSHAYLRAYWFWVSSIQDRMEVAKGEMGWQ